MLSIKQLNQKISGIRKSTATLRQNIQVVLSNAAAHAYVHGDVTSFTKLFEATSGVNRKKMVKWIADNGFANLGKDGTFKLNKKMRKEADFAEGEQVVEYLMNEIPHWFVDEESAGQIVKELDAVARIKSLTTQINNAKKSTDGKSVVKHVDFAAYRQAMDDLDAAIRATA